MTFDWFTNGTCAAPAAATSSTVALDAAGVADATGFPQTPNVSGSFAFQASYSGDGTYVRSTGPCEPLTVTTIASDTATVIHDATHATVSSVAAGTTVHDQATVTGELGDADGDGDVRLVHQRHLHGTGGGHVGPVPLDAAGVADATGSRRRRVSGSFAFQASYSGDGTYAAVDGAV